MVVGKEKERIHIGPRAGRDGGADGAREVTQMRGSGSGNAGQDTGVHLNATENPGGLAGEVVHNCLVRSRVFSSTRSPRAPPLRAFRLPGIHATPFQCSATPCAGLHWPCGLASNAIPALTATT